MAGFLRVAVLPDINGNRWALEAVLAEIDRERPDMIAVGGDIVLGPAPKETLALLAKRGERLCCIRGDGDRKVAASLDHAVNESNPWNVRERWVAEQLDADERTFLGNLPPVAMFDVEGLGRVLLCHGTPRSDEEVITRITPATKLIDILSGWEASLVVCGHTHVQYDRSLAGRRIVNAGSVGMLLEGRPGASWALLGPDVELRFTPYDVEAAAAAVRATAFPRADSFTNGHLLHPPTAEAATDLWERVAEKQYVKSSVQGQVERSSSSTPFPPKADGGNGAPAE